MGLKIKDCRQMIPHLTKLSFKNLGDVKAFIDKQKLKEVITSKLSLQETPQKILQAEIKKQYK